MSLLGTIARFPLNAIPPGLPLPILRGPLRGKFWLNGAHIHRCWIGGYELPMQKTILKYVDNYGPFWDIGAQVGYHTLLGATLAESVVAFEPLPSSVGIIREHLRLNSLNNVKVMQLAISDREGEARFASEPTRAMGKLSDSGDLLVKTASIDSLLASFRPPHAIKMDIEGGELKALFGGERCFRAFRPKLFLETHSAELLRECSALLDSYRYSLTPIAEIPLGDNVALLALPR